MFPSALNHFIFRNEMQRKSRTFSWIFLIKRFDAICYSSENLTDCHKLTVHVANHQEKQL